METDKTTSAADILVQQTVELVCSECGGGFTLEYPTLAKYVKVCPTCSERTIKAEFKEDAARVVRFGETAWRRLCPKAFQDTLPHKLPSPTKLHRVMEWKYGPKGLLLHGQTGSGKSRCLYELLKREFKAAHGILVLDHSTAYDYAESFSESPAMAHRWIEFRVNVDILAMDDIFKSKLTDSFEQAIFTVISQRTERGRPILLTTNDVGATLEGRMSPDRGPALVRRLREFCDTISF